MKQMIVNIISGLLFGIGLTLSSMVDPSKVIGFLDVMGNWDPSLSFVMMGALMIAVITFRMIPKRNKPVFANEFKLSTRTDIDKPLIIGAILFGIGWGMAGYCPGPAIATLGTGGWDSAIFLISMILGSMVQRYLYTKKESMDSGSNAACLK